MNVNAGHERTSKARIIHQIQLIRGITGGSHGSEICHGL
ncbi:Transposase [Shigella dysenteriae 1617]|uniref:Transposase n=1 Tax=Shigella dysenteriae 1617 TaxID=754093 RepID=A0A0A6ZZM0_SHIDY|nr:Transposase [Shigella dysenteriae 1617]AHA64733.1 Transposase [Shigella dysenteriae 1617]AHA65521.1 Transposase [Shigella dysenteriae 1617]AHA66279.1 Transposase [Shigella dysenteriae 1617]AHA67101.1 Transposase [Shigella dysenteriae 1617]